MMTNQFNVIVDTREKNPLEFEEYEAVATVVRTKLDTGDYCVEGLEDKLCIERKQSVSELAQNVVQDRFKREIQRMEEIPHRFILLEFNVNDVIDYPVGSNLPKRMWAKIRVKAPHIFGFLDSIQLDYNINVLFCGNHHNAQEMAYRLMAKCHKRYLQ